MSNLLDKKLNSDQIKIIQENIKNIAEKLRYIFRSREQSMEFVSHAVEAAQRYDPSLSQMTYIDYATSICCNRRNDTIRRELSRKMVQLDRVKKSMNLAVDNKNVKMIEWEDTKQNILRKMEICFSQDSNSFKKNRADQAYKILIAEYLLPMCEFKRDITLREISDITGVKISRLSHMIHGKRMRSFITSCL